MSRDSKTRPLQKDKQDAGGSDTWRARCLAETLPPSSEIAGRTTSSDEDPASATVPQIESLTELIEEEIRKSNPSRTTAPVSSASPSPPEEEPLQTYLDRYMARLMGKKTDCSVSAPASELTSSSHRVPAPSPTQAMQELPTREPVRPPECRETLAAMRELANENARLAVTEYACRDLGSRTRTAFLTAAAVSLCSSGLAVVAVKTHSPLLTAVSAAVAAIALLLTCRFCGLCRQLVSADSAPEATSA